MCTQKTEKVCLWMYLLKNNQFGNVYNLIRICHLRTYVICQGKMNEWMPRTMNNFIKILLLVLVLYVINYPLWQMKLLVFFELNTGLHFVLFIKTKNLLVLIYCNLLLSSKDFYISQTCATLRAICFMAICFNTFQFN